MSKYELTSTSKIINGHTVYKIKSISTFGSVTSGDFGGWVESESNLSQVGDCWLFDNAAAYGSSQVYDNAIIFTNVEIYENAQVYGDAFVMDNVKIYGSSLVYDFAFLYGGVEIYENAQVYGLSWIYGYAKIYGYAQVYGDSLVYENAQVYGYAQIYDSGKVYGYAQIYGNSLVDSTAQVYGNAKVYDTVWITDQSQVYGSSWVYGTAEISSNAIVRLCSRVDYNVGLNEIIETLCPVQVRTHNYNNRSEFLSGVYEDHSYHTGIDGDNMWSNILGRVPYFESAMGQEFDLKIGNYCFDFKNNKIYTNIPSGYKDLTLVWDKVLVPSGTILPYDLNPLNEQNLTFEKFFLYLSIDPNRG